jgi:hypothetical protein
MKLRVLIAAICFILPGLSYLSADIFRWTDKEGTVHFGNSVPPDAQNVKVVSKEITSGPAGNASAPEPGAKSIESILKEHEEDLKREQEARKQSDAVQNTAPPASADAIATEKERLEKKIEELEQKPLEFFGSQQNKRVRIGYYKYRLQALMEDPENYFKNPEPFEGNVPVPDKSPSN